MTVEVSKTFDAFNKTLEIYHPAVVFLRYYFFKTNI